MKPLLTPPFTAILALSSASLLLIGTGHTIFLHRKDPARRAIGLTLAILGAVSAGLVLHILTA